MKTLITSVLVMIGAAATNAQGLSEAVEKGVRDALERRDLEARAAQNRENQPAMIRGLLEAEPNPEFREFARQKLNAAGPTYPIMGTYVGGEFGSKTPGQAIEALREQFAKQEKWKIRRVPQKPIGVSNINQAAHNPKGLPPQQQNQLPQPVAAQPAPPAADQARAESTQKAITLYPDAAIKGSALNTRIQVVSQRLQATNDPILQSPSAPLVLTQIAASELGILAKTQ